MSHYFQYLLMRGVIAFFSLLPLSFTIGCARLLGNVIYLCMGRRRNVALENLNKAFGDTLSLADKKKIVRRALQSASVSLTELFMIHITKSNANERFKILGSEHLDNAFRQGQGVVLVISHLGSWEYLSFLPYLTDKEWAVVVKDIRNPYLNDYIKKLRKLTTVVPIEKNNSMRPIMRELKENHGVAVLIDQWSGAEGLWVDFFDVKTSTTSIPTRLAKKTGAPLIPAYCLRRATGKYEIHIHPPVEIDASNEDWERITTERLNSLLEDQIKKHPEQWLWGHRRWKEKPSSVRES